MNRERQRPQSAVSAGRQAVSPDGAAPRSARYSSNAGKQALTGGRQARRRGGGPRDPVLLTRNSFPYAAGR